MDSKKAQKLSKAAVATVLATSGVLVAMPHQANAYSFSDLNPNADYYEPIIDLANRKIATGYSNGTFKPNTAITREDAAKMLALTIDVNTTNPKNPGFKDVTVNNPNYRYIAALAEAGVINGYSDRTFKPKEPITRGQMAKILTLGFKFGISTKLNHGFKDVSNKNANAYFIQTLYDLNVTKGKTPVSFDPFNTVTRGQMATFIWRAEKADRGNPVYTVGDIVGNQIYINGVAYTVASHLRSIINAGNQNVLKGAYIEGSYSGKTLQNISKLTINASGTSSRLLALDGDYSSFAGELVIHGSYLRFKNIDFTGRVEVAEAPRRSLGALENVRIASLGSFASFIDWGKPNNPDNEDFLNPSENEDLQEKPDPTKPPHLQKYTERMANVKKYVDFENSDIRQLYVTADRTFLKANYDIDRLTVQGNVANMELYASPKAMYIDTDYNVSIYGVHDIQYVYKNTLKNVYLNTDSTYDYYYITSSNGFTNLGTHAYISKAIIPNNKTVNDVFDDYKIDDPNIGYVEDENGKPVDRDPVENTIITDVTSPSITQLDVAAGGSTADVTLTADEDGTYYYVIKKANEKAPSISEIKTGGTKYNGNGPLVMDEPVKFTVSGLETMTDYIIYAIVIDDADNVSEKEEQEFSTIDNRPPTFSLDKGEKMYGGKRVQFIIKGITEPGEYYYYIREKSPITMPDPTVDEIMKRYTGKGTITKPEDIVITETKYGATPAIGDIKPNTEYEIYAVMVDKSGNKMRNPAPKIVIKTEGPDTEHPYVRDQKLKLESQKDGTFTFIVNEPLDPKTALDPKNYILSGTGIINISGQKEIQPSKVELSNNGTTVKLTIPSLTALVKGDTIRVTVLKAVTDLAENEFINKDLVDTAAGEIPRNYAEYVHSDNILPEIEINKLTTSGAQHLLDIEANKAGTYYYMILPENYNFNSENINTRDMVDEFDSKMKTGKFQKNGVNDYVALGQGSAEYGKGTIIVDVPNNLNPFISYSLYIVLKDRAGLISEKWDSIKLVTDSKAPLVTIDTPVPVPNTKNGIEKNDKVEFKVTADENAKLHIIAVRKYLWNSVSNKYELNVDYFEKTGASIQLKPIQGITSSSKSSEQKDAFNKLKGGKGVKSFSPVSFNKGTDVVVPIESLDEHQEYGFYLAAEDLQGNFTVYSRASNIDPPSQNEPNGDHLIKYVYTDAYKPYIVTESNSNEGVIRRNEGGLTNNPEFTITFNELILRQNDNSGITNYNKVAPFELRDILVIKDENNKVITDEYIIAKPYGATVGTPTTAKSDLVIQLKDPNSENAKRTFTVEMVQDVTGAKVYDYENKNSFDTTKIGRYIWPIAQQRINSIASAKLVLPTGSALVESNEVKLILQLGVNLEFGQRYYYATEILYPDGTTTVPPSYKQIIDFVDRNVPIPGISRGGKGLIDNPMDISDGITLKTSGLFLKNQKIYFFTIDKYGNVFWATDFKDVNKQYGIISN